MLSWEGSDPIISENFYYTVVQAVLLFRSENPVVDGSDAEKYRGVKGGFPATRDRDEGSKARGRGLAKGGER